jgi:hypothetical protein
MTPDPTPPAAPEVAAAPAPPVAPPGTSLGHMLAIGAAIAGGGLVTLLVMTSRPTAHGEPRPLAAAAVATTSPKGAAPGVTTAVPAAPAPVWSSTHQSRWVSQGRGAAFELEANQPVSVWTKRVRPLLVVRCVDRRTDVFVYTESAARIEEQDENHTVRVAMDGEAPLYERWPDSVEHDALFAPDGQAFARRLVSARQMTFSFMPHNAATATATFEVAGLRELLTPIAKRCGR